MTAGKCGSLSPRTSVCLTQSAGRVNFPAGGNCGIEATSVAFRSAKGRSFAERKTTYPYGFGGANSAGTLSPRFAAASRVVTIRHSSPAASPST